MLHGAELSAAHGLRRHAGVNWFFGRQRSSDQRNSREPSKDGRGFKKGNIYIADQCNNRIRKVYFTGVITTVAGSGNSGGICGMATGYSGDGGPATAAQLSGPTGVAVDSAGNVYISDSGNQVIRKLDTTGKISTFAGGGTANPGNGGPATGVGFTSLLAGLAIEGSATFTSRTAFPWSAR
jgi:NHL repeat